MAAVPYTQGILLALLRADTALSAAGAGIGSLQPPDVDKRLPWVVCARVPGGSSAADVRFEDVGRIQVDAYAADPKDAVQLALTTHRALIAGWRSQTTTTDGHLTNVRAVSLPAILPQSDLPAGVHRAQALYAVSAVL
jgi:hypothetical protein